MFADTADLKDKIFGLVSFVVFVSVVVNDHKLSGGFIQVDSWQDVGTKAVVGISTLDESLGCLLLGSEMVEREVAGLDAGDVVARVSLAEEVQNDKARVATDVALVFPPAIERSSHVRHPQ